MALALPPTDSAYAPISTSATGRLAASPARVWRKCSCHARPVRLSQFGSPDKVNATVGRLTYKPQSRFENLDSGQLGMD